MPKNDATGVITPAWLTYKQAQAYAHLSRTTLWELIDNGVIRAAHVGRAVRISRDSLDEFMQRKASGVAP